MDDKNNADYSIWALSNVYGPDSARDRQILWQELRDFRASFPRLWCVVGDFNLTTFPVERKGLRSLRF